MKFFRKGKLKVEKPHLLRRMRLFGKRTRWRMCRMILYWLNKLLLQYVALHRKISLKRDYRKMNILMNLLRYSCKFCGVSAIVIRVYCSISHCISNKCTYIRDSQSRVPIFIDKQWNS
ncbi:MAG: hypothetical protein EZS28_049891 [Streblomastix strix]|uniref:Uncharacterized protein n=1 Tax=Streblomastix strix TaxID=222440 RepID=A0A5J4T9D5_9EUKA|nr:MAG: hypothetical protein EZS28_049891 [Streblomastix strix]